MKYRKIIPLILSLILIICLTVPVCAAEVSGTIRSMITYYEHHQDRAEIDIAYRLEMLAQADPALAQTWEHILDFWARCNREMDLTQEILPDGLPEDDSLCIVVLGFYLESDGSMRPELIGRMKSALASAQKYPNAYILCTGGGTAANNRSVTEAGQMAKWLKKKGIDPDRIIIEDDSMSTIENARFSTALLSRSYPQIRNLAVITSDYHVLRGALYCYTQSQLNALAGTGCAYEVVGHAAYQTGRIDSEDIHTQAEGISILADIRYKKSSPPKLAVLDHLEVTGETRYPSGMEPNLTVAAIYSNGYRKDVPRYAIFSGFDLASTGYQSVTVSYTENGELHAAQYEIELLPPATEPPASTEVPDITSAPQAAETSTQAAETPIQSSPIPETEHPIPLPLLLAIACILLLTALLLILKIRSR